MDMKTTDSLVMENTPWSIADISGSIVDAKAVKMSVCFKVQKIIGVSVGEGNLRNYQVQWEPTWVSCLQLEGCEELIEEYMQAQKDEFGNPLGAHQASMVRQNCLYGNGGEFEDEVIPIVYMNDSQCNASSADIKGAEIDDRNVEDTAQYSHKPQFPLANDDNNNDSRVLNEHTENIKTPILDHISTASEITSEFTSSFSNFADIRGTKMSEYDGNLKTLEKLIEDTRQDLMISTRKNSLENILQKKFPIAPDEAMEPSLSDTYGDEEIASTSRSSNLYKCLICEKKFKNSSGLTRHFNHAHGVEPKYKCEVCNVTFKCQYTLRRHTRTHTGVKEYTCATCDEQFEDKEEFREHLRVHSDHKRSYPCPFCGKIFTCNFGLKRHERVHTNERPFQCEVCDKRFKTNDHLQKHIRTHKDVIS